MNVFKKMYQWDEKLALKMKNKLGLTEYQMYCLAFAKGVVLTGLLVVLL